MRSIIRPSVIAVGAITVALTGSAAAVAATHGSAARGAAPKAASAKTHSLKASETEFKIKLSSKTGKPGKYKITDVNKGTVRHGLVVNGPGEKNKLIGYVKPGKSITKTIRLKKGKYDIYCPVPGHKMEGMNTHFTVK